MSRREDVENSIWADPDFLDLSPDARLLYVWSFTNPHCNMAGLYKVARSTMRVETGLPPGRLERSCDELVQGRFWVVNDAWVWVRSRVKHLRSRNPNMATSVAKDVERLPIGDPLREAFLHMYCHREGTYEWLYQALSANRSTTVVEPFRNVQGQGQGLGLGKG